MIYNSLASLYTGRKYLGGAMGIGRPIPPLTLTVEERGMLENWIRRPKTG